MSLSLAVPAAAAPWPAAGIKRLPRPDRDGWFELVGQQQRALPAYRDLLLAAIERDSAQWAYLFGTAARWRGNTDKVVRTAFSKVGRSAGSAWYGKDRRSFEELKQRLFKTASELREQFGEGAPL